MTFSAFVIYTSELCLYFSTAGFLVSLCGPVHTTLPVFALLLLTECLSSALAEKKAPLRFLPMLLLIPLFFRLPSAAAAVQLAPYCLLIGYRAARKAWGVERESLKSVLKIGLVLFAVMLFVTFLTDRSADFRMRALPYSVAWFLLTVFALRLLRSEDQGKSDFRSRLLQFLTVAAVAAVGFLLGTETCAEALRIGAGAVYQYVLVPILFIGIVAVAVIPGLLIFLIARLIHLLRGESVQAADELLADTTETVLETVSNGQAAPPEWLTEVLTAVGIVLFIAICFLLFRRHLVRRKNTPNRKADGITRRTVSSDEAAHTSVLHTRPGTAAETVRRCYRKYLKLCTVLQIPVDGTIASDEIAKQSRYMTGEKTEVLRDIWLFSRYGEADPDETELRLAKDALRQIRSDSAAFQKKLKHD